MTNSANPATGVAQAAGAPIGPDEKAYYCAIRECDQKKLTPAQKNKVANSDKPCATLGSIKHACVRDKTKNRPGCQNEPAYDTGKNPPAPLMRSPPNQNQQCTNLWSGWASMQRSLKAAGQSYTKGRLRFPDFVINGPPKQILDAKFPCPDRVASGNLGKATKFPSADRYGKFNSDGQEAAYKKIMGKGNPNSPKAVSPKDAKGLKCN